jgi:small subunit ribosomal protein S1
MSSDRPKESFAELFEQSGKAAPPRRGPRVGEVLDAIVVQVGKEAVFVELDGRRQAFIETNDLRGPEGTVGVAVGDVIRARVTRVDDEGIRLSPTVEAAVAMGASVDVAAAAGAGAGAPEGVKVAVGQVVSGAVERVETYGVFVQMDGTKGRAGRGLVPTVELGVPRGTDLRKAFPLGTKMKAKVLDLTEGKMRLSVRALADDAERAELETFRAKEQKESGGAQGFGTFGDLLKKRPPK